VVLVVEVVGQAVVPGRVHGRAQGRPLGVGVAEVLGAVPVVSAPSEVWRRRSEVPGAEDVRREWAPSEVQQEAEAVPEVVQVVD
jgi:hypothetical protein